MPSFVSSAWYLWASCYVRIKGLAWDDNNKAYDDNNNWYDGYDNNLGAWLPSFVSFAWDFP